MDPVTVHQIPRPCRGKGVKQVCAVLIRLVGGRSYVCVS